jgi:hypothetical protein
LLPTDGNGDLGSTIQRLFSSNLPSENSCNFLNIALKLTNEVLFERRKIYLSTDYNIMIMQQLHNYYAISCKILMSALDQN